MVGVDPVGCLADFIVTDVGPDQGVEVDGAPSLELDHLHIRQPQPAGRFPGAHAQQRPEGPQGVDGGPPPELGDPGVEQHRPLVVVAVGAEGLAEVVVVLVVAPSADQGPPVGTALAGRVAGAVRSLPVDRSEAGGGEGEQDRRVLGDGLGHLLPTPESRRHQGEGVAPVEGGTGWAERLPSRPTGLEQHPVRQAPGVEAHLVVAVAGAGRDPTGQPDRPPAAPDRPDLGLEGVVAAGAVQPGEDPLDHPPVVIGHGHGGHWSVLRSSSARMARSNKGPSSNTKHRIRRGTVPSARR